jgi:hypothetical protein
VPAGLQLFMHNRRRGDGLDFIEDRLQFFVIGNDKLRGFRGDMGIGCKNGGHRLADEMHFL